MSNRYQQDFIGQWRAFLRSANVVRYNGLPDASQKLLKLSGNQSPLLALFCVAAQNTAVDQPDVVKAFQPVQSVVVPATCQDQYIGGSNQPYVAGLSGIQVCLDQANNAPVIRMLPRPSAFPTSPPLNRLPIKLARGSRLIRMAT